MSTPRTGSRKAEQAQPPPAAPPAVKHKPSRSQPSRAVGSQLRLGKTNDAWTYMANPMVLQCLRGHIVPCLAKALDTPGLHGNNRGKSGKGMQTALSHDGYEVVPHDIDCIAFGQPRAGEESNYYDKWTEETDDGEVRHTLHREAWWRPRILGVNTVWDFDETGWVDFHRRVMDMLAPDGLDPAQIEIATRDLFRSIRDTAAQDSARAARMLPDLLKNVPREHAPADILALMGDPSPE